MKIDQLGLLVTVVLAFSAPASLALTGQAGIREDMRAPQAGMLAEQSELRAEVRAGQAELGEAIRAGQAELRVGQAGLREETRSGQAELRAGQKELREEMGAGRAGLREELAVFGMRLAVVEHRTDALESRLEASGRPEPEPCEGAACPGS